MKGTPDLDKLPADSRSTFAVSQNGVLAYRSGASSPPTQLTWRDGDGKVLDVVGKAGELLNLSLSPDEKSDPSHAVISGARVTVTDIRTNATHNVKRDRRLWGNLALCTKAANEMPGWGSCKDSAPPPELDWDPWPGPVPTRPYNPF